MELGENYPPLPLHNSSPPYRFDFFSFSDFSAPPPPPPMRSSPPPPTRAPLSSAPTRAAPLLRPSDHVWAHHLNMLNSAAAGTSSMMGDGPSSFDQPQATTSSRDEASVSISNASDMETTEWIEQDEPGVCLTIRELGDGTRELRCIRFSRERFGEDKAKVWCANCKGRWWCLVWLSMEPVVFEYLDALLFV